MVTLIDVSVSSQPWRYGQLYVTVAYGQVYLVFQITYLVVFGGTDADGHDYIYSIFKWKTETLKATGYAAGMTIVLILAYTLLWCLAFLRDKLWRRLFSAPQDEAATLELEFFETKTEIAR